jgi:hypothetical protein
MAITLNNLDASSDPKDKNPSIKYKIYLALAADVDLDNWPAVVSGAIPSLPMKTGKVCKYIEVQDGSIKPNAAAVGEVAPQGQLTILANIEGIYPEMLQWLYEQNGNKFVVIWEHCVSGKKYIAGSPCSTLKLSYTALGLIEDWLGANIQWVGAACMEPFWFFNGTVPLVPPANP